MYEPTNAHSAIHVLYYEHLLVLVTFVTVFRVYSINIRNTVEVVYDKILQDLVQSRPAFPGDITGY